MKNELLRLEHISTSPLKNLTKLNNFSLNIYSGELFGIISYSSSFKKLLLKVLRGKIDFSGTAYFNEKQVSSFANSLYFNSIAIIENTPFLFPYMTIADNIALSPNVSEKHIFTKKKKEYLSVFSRFESLALNINPFQKLKNTSAFLGNMVELTRQLNDETKLVVFSDCYNTYSDDELLLFSNVIDKLLEQNIAVICMSFKPFNFLKKADRVLIFKDSTKMKTFTRSHYVSENEFENVIFKNCTTEKLPDNIAISENQIPSYYSPVVFAADDVLCNGVNKFSFNLHRGEILGIKTPNYNKCLEVSNTLCGNTKPISGGISVLNKNIHSSKPTNIKKNVYLLTLDSTLNQIFPNLSVFENLDFPLFYATGQKYFLRSNRISIKKSLKSEITESLGFSQTTQAENIETLNYHSQWNLILFRTLLQKPQVLICCAPSIFMNKDSLTNLNQFFIKYIQRGGSIIIISPVPEDFQNTKIIISV